MSDLIINTSIFKPSPTIEINQLSAESTIIQLDNTQSQLIRSNHLMNVFFRKPDLEELLAQDNCVGLRFYPAFNLNGNPSLLAVAINNQRQDLVENVVPSHTTGDKCFISQGRSVGAINIPVSDGDSMILTIGNMIDNAKNNNIISDIAFPLANTSNINRSYAKVVFTRTSIENMLSEDDVEGIEFFTTKMQFSDTNDSNNYKTLAAAPVLSNNATSTSNMTLSALPCPPYCGGRGYRGNEAVVS